MKWIAADVVAFLVLICGVFYISAYNTGNQLENNITAAWENNENILAQYGQKIQELAQVPAMQRDDVAKVLSGALESRYGANGSQATMQWIREQNPNIDTKVYSQIMRVIEAGRNEFQNAQTDLVRVKMIYKTELGSFWKGMWLSVAGYPKIDLAKYKVITTNRAAKAFATGVEDAPIKLR